MLAYVGQDAVATGNLIASRMISDGKIKPRDHGFCPVEFPTAAYASERYAGVKKALDKIGATCEMVDTGQTWRPLESRSSNTGVPTSRKSSWRLEADVSRVRTPERRVIGVPTDYWTGSLGPQ